MTDGLVKAVNAVVFRLPGRRPARSAATAGRWVHLDSGFVIERLMTLLLVSMTFNAALLIALFGFLSLYWRR